MRTSSGELPHCLDRAGKRLGYAYKSTDLILVASSLAAIYCRLSKDGDLSGESAGINDQLLFILNFTLDL